MTVAPGPEDAIVTAIAAWNAGDREGFIGMSHPDVVWKMAGLFPGLRSTYRGHDEMREFWDAFHEPWETLQIEIGEMAELDCESLLVAVHFHAKGRGGSRSIDGWPITSSCATESSSTCRPSPTGRRRSPGSASRTRAETEWLRRIG